jgi:hypothetical protein
MEQTCRLCGVVRLPDVRRCDCGYVYSKSENTTADDLTDGEHPYPVVIGIPTGPVGCVLSIMMLAMTGSNGAGICLMLMALVPAVFISQTLGGGVWSCLLLFGVLAIVLDAVGRRLQGCAPFDVKAGSQFMLFPVWLLGVFGLLAGMIALAAAYS